MKSIRIIYPGINWPNALQVSHTGLTYSEEVYEDDPRYKDLVEPKVQKETLIHKIKSYFTNNQSVK